MTPRTSLCVLLALLPLAACGGDEGAKQPLDGPKVFSLYCKTCHTIDGAGGPLGPPLRGVAATWEREDLKSYIRNPDAFAERDARLKALKGKYRMPMPKSNLKDEHLEVLVDYVLGL